MTTIAIDHNSVCADGLAVRDSVKEDTKCKKLIKRDGVIYAMAGRIEHCMILVDHLSEVSDEVLPDVDGNVISIENGEIRLHWIQDGKIDSDLIVPPYAIGSGSSYAYTELRNGKTAREAVKTAAKIDLYTGGNLTEFKYK